MFIIVTLKIIALHELRIAPPSVVAVDLPDVPYTWLVFFLALTLTRYVVFGDRDDRTIDAFVDDEVENFVQLLPSLRLYSHTSAVAEEVEDILNPLADILDIEHETDGAVLSILFRDTDVDAVIVLIYTPLYVPLNRHEADSCTPFFSPFVSW